MTAALARRVRAELPAAEPELLGYKPRARAVLAAGDRILKAYGSERRFRAALAGLRGSAAAPLRAPAFVTALPELRVTVQRRAAGARPETAADAAEAAGALAAALQRAALPGLPAAPPERLLAAARRKAGVIGAVLPDLRPRLDALVRALAATVPAGTSLVAAHGDFHADQLLLDPGGITVVDFDELCTAAPALDLATYAADVVRGRPGDDAALDGVLDGLLAGYGDRPAALEWHLAAALLGRAAHPFQRQAADWPERTERMLAAAEAHL